MSTEGTSRLPNSLRPADPLAESAQWVADAAGVLAELPGVKFLPALGRANVLGALDMGLSPGVLPGRLSLDEGRHWFRDAWGAIPEERGLDATGILSAAAEGKVQGLVLLGAGIALYARWLVAQPHRPA